MWVAAILLGTILGLISMWVIERRSSQQTIKRLGLPGPKPNLLLGNFAEMRDIAAQGENYLIEWYKKYGKTYGYYEGGKPVIVTSDIELTKHVLIKNFGAFHARRQRIFATSDDAIEQAHGEQWKHLRSIVSPTFSAGRMKEMSPLINKCVTDLLAVLEKRVQEEKPFNISRDLQECTLSTIALCAFGLEVDAFKDPDNIFLKKCNEYWEKLAGNSFLVNYIIPLTIAFPGLVKILKYISRDIFTIPCQWFFDTTERIIEERKTRKNGIIRRDFIQLMLEAEEKGIPDNMRHLQVSVDQDTKEASHSGSQTSRRPTTPKTNVSNVGQGKGLTLREIQSTCMSFLLAGYETTSSTLSLAIYELTRHPDIQRKLQEEIDKFIPKGILPDYLSVQKMPYLERFFNEVLRFYMNVHEVLNRQCFEDITIGDLHIPKGTDVQINVRAIHRDPELWGPEDPELFVPDRFLPERKAARPSVAWLAFGGGPRNCVGVRFGLMEVKIALARILRDYSVVKGGEQELILTNKHLAFTGAKRDLFVSLQRR